MDSHIQHPELLADIEAFLAETGLSASYTCKAGGGESNIHARLSRGGFVSPRVETKLRAWMAERLSAFRSRQTGAAEHHSDPAPVPAPVLIEGNHGRA